MPKLTYQINLGLMHEIRSRLLLSQKEFATLLNQSVSTVQKWEQGRTTPGTKALRKLLRLTKPLGIGYEQLIQRVQHDN